MRHERHEISGAGGSPPEESARDAVRDGDAAGPAGTRCLAWNLLRIGAAMCFIGHGAFGIMTKEAWVPYFGFVGIPPDLAYALMPVVGSVDILVGVLALLRPARVVFAYMAVWALWTAALRPLTGEPVWELLERAGNYGVPLALLLMAGLPSAVGSWWARLTTKGLRPRITTSVIATLYVTVVLLVLGHAGYGLEGRARLAGHYGLLGWSSTSVFVVGGFELGLAAAIASAASPLLLALTAVWKIGSELLYPLAGDPVWEFVERSGSYVAPLALGVMLVRMRPADATAGMLARSLWRITRPVRGKALPVLAAGSVAIAVGASTARAAGSPPLGVPAHRAPLVDREPAVAGVGRVDTVWNRMSRAALIRELDAGALVIACRHAITDRSHGDARRVDFSDRGTQRNLSSDGERQARELGREIAALGIPIGPVLASPYARTFESAELAFGHAAVSEALYGERPRTDIRPLFAEPTDGSGNRVLVTHQYVLRRMLRVFRPGEIEEGDCVVVRPLGAGGYDIAAHLSPNEWGGLR